MFDSNEMVRSFLNESDLFTIKGTNTTNLGLFNIRLIVIILDSITKIDVNIH